MHAFESVASTMDEAHRMAAEGAPEKTLIWAARQEQGRGRLGRTWVSPAGGAYCSMILKPARPLEEIPQLSLVAGLAVAEAIQDLTGLFASIRWPNDLLLNEKKVAGILVEARNGAVIIGIGINVTTAPEALPDTATSLAAALGSDPSLGSDPCKVTAEVCRRFKTWYDAWTESGFAPIREALRPWIGLFGHPVHLTAGNQRLEGTAQDLDEQGRLVVRLDSGVLRAFDVGEVALLR